MEIDACLISQNHEVELEQTRLLQPHDYALYLYYLAAYTLDPIKITKPNQQQPIVCACVFVCLLHR